MTKHTPRFYACVLPYLLTVYSTFRHHVVQGTCLSANTLEHVPIPEVLVENRCFTVLCDLVSGFHGRRLLLLLLLHHHEDDHANHDAHAKERANNDAGERPSAQTATTIGTGGNGPSEI